MSYCPICRYELTTAGCACSRYRNPFPPVPTLVPTDNDKLDHTDRHVSLCNCDFCVLYADLNDDEKEEGEP